METMRMRLFIVSRKPGLGPGKAARAKESRIA